MKLSPKPFTHAGSRLAASLLALVLLAGCRDAPKEPRPILLLAIDGAEWSVIEELWSQGELPHLKALADRGVSSGLKTGYNSKSPVVWTTVATGVTPKEHGIDDFVLSTESGDIPVSSTARKVPAIWNMLSATGKSVAVFGWWASWPPEEVDGVILSDRAARDVDNRTSPEGWWEELSLDIESADLFPPGVARDQDELVAAAARTTQSDDYDLQLVYLRSVDTMSHTYWRYFRPKRYPELAAEELSRFSDRIPRAYAAVDRVLGELTAEGTPERNVIVISDHGFYGMKQERRRVVCNLDAILQRLGFLKRKAGSIHLEKTRVYTHASAHAQAEKLLRTPGRSTLSSAATGDATLTREGQKLFGELGEALQRVRYSDGAPLFELRLPTADEIALDAELVVQVLQPLDDEPVQLDGDLLTGLVEIERLSGSHGGSTHGIFIAAGPDIDPAADLAGIGIHDIAPTLLYGLGLPVALDFAGRAWEPLFRSEFQSRQPLRIIPSWGTRDATGATVSEDDQELIEQLEALGYL